MRKIFLSAAVFALLASSCQNEVLIEQTEGQENGHFVSLNISKGFESRTVLGNDKATLWSAGDQIYVCGNNGKVAGILTLKGDGGSDKGLFEGYVSGEPSELQHIVFPAPKNGKIDMSAREAAKLDAPMIGTLENGEVKTFNNVGSLLAVKVVGAEGNIYQVNATSGTNNMTGGSYTFDATTGKLTYQPANNPVEVKVNDNGYAYIPVATTTNPTDGQETTATAVSVDVEMTAGGSVITNGHKITITSGEIMGDDETTGLEKIVNEDGSVTPVLLVNNEDELKEALANEENTFPIVLNNDINVDSDNTITIAAGREVVLNLDGHTIAGVSDMTGSNRNMFDVRGIFSVQNGTITTEHNAEKNMGWNNSTNVFNVTAGGVLNIDDAIIENLGGSDMAFCVHLNNWGTVTLNAENTTFKSNYVGVRIFNSGNDMNNVTLENCDFLTGNSCIWVHNYTAADFSNNIDKAIVAAARLNFNFTNTTISRTNGSKSLIRMGMTNAIYYSDIEMTNVVAGTEAALKWALENGKNVLLNNNLTDLAVETKAPYGNHYGVAQNGGVLDGNGFNLDFDSPSGDNYGIMTAGGTIKNMTITGVFRGIVIMNPTEDLYIDNVVIGDDDVCYAINTAEGDGTHSLIVTNSTIKGWNSYGTVIKDLSFSNCTFAQGTYYTNVYGRLVKPYVNAVFENCEFGSKYYIDLSALEPDAQVKLKNCTINGVKLSSSNWKNLIAAEENCGEGQISIELRDGTYLTADNIVDYIIFE